jgi:hypothetical protein
MLPFGSVFVPSYVLLAAVSDAVIAAVVMLADAVALVELVVVPAVPSV